MLRMLAPFQVFGWKSRCPFYSPSSTLHDSAWALVIIKLVKIHFRQSTILQIQTSHLIFELHKLTHSAAGFCINPIRPEMNEIVALLYPCHSWFTCTMHIYMSCHRFWWCWFLDRSIYPVGVEIFLGLNCSPSMFHQWILDMSAKHTCNQYFI